MRILITFFVIVVIFCILTFDKQLRENYTTKKEDTYSLYEHPEEVINLKNFKNFMSQIDNFDYQDNQDNQDNQNFKISISIVDIHNKFLENFYQSESYRFDVFDETQEYVEKKKVVITNLANLKQFIFLKKNKDNFISDSNPEIQKFIKLDDESILKNYCTVYINPYFYQNMDDSDMYIDTFYIFSKDGKEIYSYINPYAESASFENQNTLNNQEPETDDKMKKTISSIIKTKVFNSGVEEPLKYFIYEFSSNNNYKKLMKLNLKVKISKQQELIEYNFKTESILEKESMEEAFMYTINGYTGTVYGSMMNNNNNQEVLNKSILKNNLKPFRDLCYLKQSQTQPNSNGTYDMIYCDNIIFTLLNDYSNYKELVPELENNILTLENNLEFKITNIENKIENYHLLANIYHNLYYDKYNPDSHNIIIKLLISIAYLVEEHNNKVEEENNKLQNMMYNSSYNSSYNNTIKYTPPNNNFYETPESPMIESKLLLMLKQENINVKTDMYGKIPTNIKEKMKNLISSANLLYQNQNGNSPESELFKIIEAQQDKNNVAENDFAPELLIIELPPENLKTGTDNTQIQEENNLYNTIQEVNNIDKKIQEVNNLDTQLEIMNEILKKSI